MSYKHDKQLLHYVHNFGFLNFWDFFGKLLSPQVHSAVIGALVYRGIPSDLRSRPEQSHHLPGALLLRWLQAVYRVSNGRPHLQLYRKGAYIHYLWVYSENTVKQGVLFDKHLPFGRRFNLACAICWMRAPVYRLTTSKGLNSFINMVINCPAFN